MARTAFLPLLLASVVASCAQDSPPSPATASSRPPNFVIVFADDLGWGDLGSYGAPVIRTPHLDRMAAEGQRWTNFYVTASVCSPSRAGLLTGRLPVRNGLYGDRVRVLFPDFVGGIQDEEITIAEALRDLGYATGMFGKWHLGDRPRYLPTRHGFDYWFGIPYSNDMMSTLPREERRAAFLDPKIEYWDVPLIRSERDAAGEIVTETLEQPADQTTITKRYAEEAVDFIRAHRDVPFFVYVPHSMPHVPLFRAPDFEGHSGAGLYGDVIEEIDWSVGRILDTLEEEGLSGALGRQMEAMESRHGLETEVSLEGEPELPLATKQVLYRVAQEALHNVVKHARASRVWLTLRHSGDRSVLEVGDDGVGFDPEDTPPGHLGLRSMRERVEESGGEFRLLSTPGRGTEIRVAVPEGTEG